MYFGIVLGFIFISVAFSDPKGQIYALILVVLAATESAVGLGVLIVLYRHGQSIDFKTYQEIKG
jgi:NADH-quinone oxidoreductase subunit K